LHHPCSNFADMRTGPQLRLLPLGEGESLFHILIIN
jgi:hypothetical protein